MDAGGVGARVAEVAALRSLTLTATIGTVAIEGPAGVADATPHAFAPAGGIAFAAH